MDLKILSNMNIDKLNKFLTLIGYLFVVLSLFLIVKPEPFLRLGYPGIFVFSIFGPGSILVPVLVNRFNLYLLAICTAMGMAINDSITWYIGRNTREWTPKSKKIMKLEESVHKYGMFALFFWALIPFPYDIIGFIAGYLRLPYWKFIIPTFLGRFIRFILIGWGIVKLFF